MSAAMSTFKSDLLIALSERGFVHQISDPEGLDAMAAKGAISGYVGYDATATSLHIGNLITASMLYWLQQTGHQAIALMGGGTSMVGDPSFRDDQRKILSVDEIARNIEGIKKIFSRVLSFEGGSNPAIMVNNADWLLKLNYVEFLRDVGRFFSVNRMLSFDSVKLRLDREQSLSFLEFNYMIMQGYDFVELNRRYGTVLQMGGSDQWGNIINGVDLSHRMGGPQLYALTTPLLATSSGQKMGKTASGAVWLNDDLFSPYEFWQYFRNTEDGDVGRFLKIFTRLPLNEIARLEALGGAEINAAKKILATEATAIVHGRAAADEAAAAAQATFEGGSVSADITTRQIERGPGKNGATALAILEASSLVRSRTEGRQKIAEHAVRINDEPVTDPQRLFGYATVDPTTGAWKVQLGKKKIVLVKPA
jgi:tyrosyl-tRNA synthetase